MRGRLIAVLAAGVLAGCARAPIERAADPVIAGTRHAGAIELGPVRMHLVLHEDATPANARLSLGFVAAGDAARVVMSRATLGYAGRAAELVARQAAPGAASGCAAGGGKGLDLDYWFNATVTAESWTCVTLAFVMPQRRAGDALELRIESLTIDGEVVHTLPVTFARRAAE